MEITIRNEAKSDYRKAEELTRSLLDLYVPGCDEHYLVHVMIDHPDFITELDFVAIYKGNVRRKNNKTGRPYLRNFLRKLYQNEIRPPVIVRNKRSRNYENKFIFLFHNRKFSHCSKRHSCKTS